VHIEWYHRELKYKYFNGKTVKHDDKTIESMFTLMHDKQCDRIQKILEDKLSFKVASTDTQHVQGVALVEQCQQISNNEWNVPSLSTPGIV